MNKLRIDFRELIRTMQKKADLELDHGGTASGSCPSMGLWCLNLGVSEMQTDFHFARKRLPNNS